MSTIQQPRAVDCARLKRARGNSAGSEGAVVPAVITAGPLVAPRRSHTAAAAVVPRPRVYKKPRISLLNTIQSEATTVHSPRGGSPTHARMVATTGVTSGVAGRNSQQQAAGLNMLGLAAAGVKPATSEPAAHPTTATKVTTKASDAKKKPLTKEEQEHIRKMRNRRSAALSRKRRRAFMQDLAVKVDKLDKRNKQLEDQLAESVKTASTYARQLRIIQQIAQGAGGNVPALAAAAATIAGMLTSPTCAPVSMTVPAASVPSSTTSPTSPSTACVVVPSVVRAPSVSAATTAATGGDAVTAAATVATATTTASAPTPTLPNNWLSGSTPQLARASLMRMGGGRPGWLLNSMPLPTTGGSGAAALAVARRGGVPLSTAVKLAASVSLHSPERWGVTSTSSMQRQQRMARARAVQGVNAAAVNAAAVKAAMLATSKAGATAKPTAVMTGPTV